MDIRTELINIEEAEIRTTKWLKYFMSEITNLKKELEAVKKKEELLGQSVLKLYGDK